MKRLALAILALAVIVIAPAWAQSSVPVKNALVVVSGQQDLILQSMLATGGSPYNVQKALELAGRLSNSAPHTSTDTSGKFELNETLHAGTYNVTAFAPGFVSMSDNLAIDGSVTAKNLTIFMQPSAMVSGRVTDEHGLPLAGILVAASSPHSANYDITMDDGIFLLDTGLKSGQYNFYTFKPGIDVARLQGLLNNTEPSLLDNKIPAIFNTQNSGYVANVTALKLEQGKLSTLNVELKTSSVVSGRVTNETGSPVPDIAVFAFDSSGGIADTAGVTDSEGRYILGNDLAAGKYSIVIPSVFSKGYSFASASATVPAKNAVNFVLYKSSVISGRVVDANGDPVAGAAISAISKGMNVDDTHLAQFLAAGMATSKTNKAGKFTLDSGIDNGTYFVTASFGSVPVNSSVEVPSGRPAIIALDFRDTIKIKGTVTDESGKPIENASVVPSFASAITGAELFETKTGPDGVYDLTIPIKDNGTRSLFDEISVTADGFKSATAQSNATVMLNKMPVTKITGVVIAQKSLTPSVETVLVRKGTVAFEHEGAHYGVGLQTNSRVLYATFEPQSKSISINLEGVLDASGKSEFSIPKEFMSGPFVITLDGRPAKSASVTENQTQYTIALEHEHDVQKITIQGATAVPEFPLPSVLAAGTLAVLIAWKRLRH